MHRILRTAILITFGMLITGIIGGCADDDSPEQVTQLPQPEDDVPPSPVLLVIVDPAGGHIPTNTEFTLTFNEQVKEVTVNGIPARGSGAVWKTYLPLEEGPGQILHIKWVNQDGSMGTKDVGPYTVSTGHDGAPVITGGTVADGAADVDPAPINVGGFQFDFDEDVTGTIKLTDEAGNDLNWIGSVAGPTTRLTPVAGQELVNETTYKIEINVADGSGNRTQVTITFVTKPKE